MDLSQDAQISKVVLGTKTIFREAEHSKGLIQIMLQNLNINIVG